MLAASRGLVGTAFLIVFLRLRGRGVHANLTGRQIVWYALCGALMGIDWILLFDAYNYTSVAVATLCYYTMPVFVTLGSVLLFGEKPTVKKAVCIAVCILGMLLVTGVLGSGLPGPDELRGILLSLAAAVVYAAVVLMNKKMSGVDAYGKTIVQLLASSLALLPYVLLTEDLGALPLSGRTLIMLLVVGIVHTGIAYALYFGCIDALKAQTVAIFGYLDPIVAVLLSVALLGEPLTAPIAAGVILVIGGAIASET